MEQRSLRAAYVGILTPGSTSRMRAAWLKQLTPGWSWEWVDTDPPLMSTARPWRSLAYRYHLGAAVTRINREVTSRLTGSHLDLIWVDKAVFLQRDTMGQLRLAGRKLVHYTPDTAFGPNSSRYFEASLPLFDLVVTTKSFDLPEYGKRVDAQRIMLVTQGFDPAVHYPRSPDEERQVGVAFIGLAEPARERAIGALLAAGVPIRLAGRGWSRFVSKWKNSPHLDFRGDDCFGDDYATALSSSWIGLGLLSKKFPEQHTTRTFEIPACGAVLATEDTAETRSYFARDEAVFFKDNVEMVHEIRRALSGGATELRALALSGRERVLRDRRDYPNILRSVLEHSAIR